jgi:hypothetical protein
MTSFCCAVSRSREVECCAMSSAIPVSTVVPETRPAVGAAPT